MSFERCGVIIVGGGIVSAARAHAPGLDIIGVWTRRGHRILPGRFSSLASLDGSPAAESIEATGGHA